MDQTLEQDRSSGADQFEELESEVKNMAEKILHYRKTLPVQLKSRLSAVLSAQVPPDSGCEPGTSDPESTEHAESDIGKSVVDNEQTAERIRLLKHKISTNASALPNALKRMKECLSMMEKLESNNEVIHPAFKRVKSR